VLKAGSVRIGSASAEPDISYPTEMGVPFQLQANVVGSMDGELALVTAATRSDIGGSARPVSSFEIADVW
jgi:hypothetical protein